LDAEFVPEFRLVNKFFEAFCTSRFLVHEHFTKFIEAGRHIQDITFSEDDTI
jgi:hypothetical protein